MKVGLVDDQVLFLHGIAQIISSQPDMDVIWQANDGEDALTQCAATPADVVLMDVQMPVRDGISATAEIASTLPETKVIILTTFDDEDYVVAGLRAGASGFVLKDAEPEELLSALRTVYRGDAVISPRATKRLVHSMRDDSTDTLSISGADRRVLESLTAREQEILEAIGMGWSNTEICERMFISMPTVKTHVGRVLAKTSSRDRVHAALFAYRTGVVSRADLLSS
ncbi:MULTISPECIES: response regulator transcription factor [Corynebacterium]|uniref:Response regulator receiver domain protein n=1 Tax=Corynebacterium pseudogenitalium ATCC 33035 TaxID=525264 RepID=E2S1G0_9CORY|nr:MULTISPECIES: response regulator transcription factor [Corynebacterium]EFQ81476.1 response regulator receiver domain protein [Corynebacterium pseudogenitalium ATCC 33035]MCG7455599.1 response regulator transcription factor [Corynebacterium tuberculostearicum]MCG7462006.1 response regulator transcription factor [Corynebacterium sp. ACRPF]MCG7464250.1 response regulator transcription factor [Corynebacterium tuberculostearicum]MDK8837196.1 response regulator transcription factor [Corynebacteri